MQVIQYRGCSLSPPLIYKALHKLSTQVLTILQHMFFQRQWWNYSHALLVNKLSVSVFALCVIFLLCNCWLVIVKVVMRLMIRPLPHGVPPTHPLFRLSCQEKKAERKSCRPKNSEKRSAKLNQKRKLRRVDPLWWERVKAAQETREHHLHSNVRYLLSKLPGLVRREGGGEAWGKKLSDDAISLLFSTIKSDRSCNSPSFDTNLTENQVEKLSK